MWINTTVHRQARVRSSRRREERTRSKTCEPGKIIEHTWRDSKASDNLWNEAGVFEVHQQRIAVPHY